MDRITTEARSRNMSRVKNKNTGIELSLRKALWRKNIRFRINNKDVLGKPDIVIKKLKLAIFCDGDFWHGRNFSENTVSTHKEFWTEKIRSNRERDLEQTIALRDTGWTVLRFWGSDIKKDPDAVANRVVEEINAIKERKENVKAMQILEFKNEFAERFAHIQWDTERLGGANCPAIDSYDFYNICFLQTIEEMKRLGYRIPKSFRMPKEAVVRAEAVLREVAITWRIVY